MKIFNKVVLINWHYFAKETIELDTINFLTGKNGSGKTTVVDAIQLLMLGDTTGHFFNKSATEKSSRTLKGYLKCEIGDDDKGNPLYLRNGRFTSYVMGEFFDDNENKNITLGVAFDVFEDGHINYKFFSFDGSIPENDFIQNKVPYNLKELKIFLLENFKSEEVNFFETNISYREFLKEKLGNLPSSFFPLFKKAIPFSPISNIETFITEYVCDVDSSIDITSMQENIRNYKRLEEESEVVEKRVEDLNKIEDIYSKWKEKDDAIANQRYTYYRGLLQVKTKELEKQKIKLEEKNEDLGEISLLLERNSKEMKEVKQNKEKLIEEKYSMDIYKKKADIEEKKEQLQVQINDLQETTTNIMYDLENYKIQWLTSMEKVLNYDEIDNNNLKKLKEEAKKCLKEVNDFAKNIEFESLDFEKINKLHKDINTFKNQVISFIHSLEVEKREYEDRKDELTNSLSNLSKGVKNYDYRLLQLKNIIEERLSKKHNKEVKVNILADLLEIKNPKWKNAIEGYLSSQKFYLFVEPMHFEEALKIYDQIKFEYNLFDFGLVDAKKVLDSSFSPKHNSLAEEIDTSDKYARAYIDSLIGTLIKCEKVENLRNYSRSITPTGMVYQGFVARQINKNRWRNHFIGKTSLGSEKDLIKDEIRDLENKIEILDNAIYKFDDIANFEIINKNEIKNIENSSKSTSSIHNLIKQKNELESKLEGLDLSYVNKIEKNISKTNNKIDELESQKDELLSTQAKRRTQLERLKDFDIPLVEDEVKEAKKVIYDKFIKDWILSKGEPFFMRELDKIKNIDNLIKIYKNRLDNADDDMKVLREKLISLRSQYNSKFNVSYNYNSEDNSDYSEELNDFVENKLADYKEKIYNAKTNAIQQFRDDFLSKLKSHFDDIKMQIDSLNDALKDSTFGTDKYEFTMEPRYEYKEYYDMIMDPILMEGHSIGEEDFKEKYGDVIEDLFTQITFADKELDTDTRSEIERNIEKFTDYRTYLKFDLIVSDEFDRKQRLSKTLLKKSGGETQTPFYISVLASFAQLYRLGEASTNKSSKTLRLIVFDEAFSKMDSERIQESVKLLRNYGLQAILSAPPEKMSDIVPLVDNTVCVIRDDQKSFIRNYTKNTNEKIKLS